MTGEAWGHSSVGRALQWHCRGQGFDSPWLHQFLFVELMMMAALAPPFSFFAYRSIRRSRSALEMTETEDSDIAAAAIIGESTMPKIG